MIADKYYFFEFIYLWGLILYPYKYYRSTYGRSEGRTFTRCKAIFLHR